MTLESAVRRLHFSRLVARSALDVNSRFACDLFCDLVEGVVPGFAAVTQRQIDARVMGRDDENERAFEEAAKMVFEAPRWRFLRWFAIRIATAYIQHNKGKEG